jgi:hypothetical protein
MKSIKILCTSILLYTLLGISSIYANSITPAINEVQLPQGQRTLSYVTFENKEDRDIEILLKVYEYNPKTDQIIQDSKSIFLKADTDTFTIQAGTKRNIPYEIYPVENIEKGTYFNILVLTEVVNPEDVYINKGISQLVILHVVDEDAQVAGVTTSDYISKIEVLNKGIPFLVPLKIKYTVQNNSNYVITPKGRIEIFNSKGNSKPEYIYINTDEKKVYPKEMIEETVTLNKWSLFDIPYERVAIGNFTNGLDSKAVTVEKTINSYIYEILGILTVLVVASLLIKSLKEDLKKKN